MKMTQVYEIANSMAHEFIGESAVVNEDLSNVVDVGKQILDSTSIDNYTKSLVDHIGKVVLVDRKYELAMPSVMMDSWEFGAIMEKIQAELPDASQNDSWALENGKTYNQDIFYKPTVSAKFYSERVTFDIKLSITEEQIKSAFSGAQQLNAFMSMLYTAIDNSMSLRLSALIKSTVNNMTAQTIYDEYKDASGAMTAVNAKSGVAAVNLLYKYNTEKGTNLTADKAILDPEFIRYASYEMANYIDRLKEPTKLFNIEGKVRATPNSLLNVVLLSQFKNAAAAYLQSDTFHNEYTALPDAETVAFWQGNGQDFAFDNASKIDIKIKNPTTTGEATIEVSTGGILGIMFDRNALGVTNMNRRTTSHWNAEGEFTNQFYKMDAGYFNDLQENYVVFFVA